jgi:hypothetical protein
VTCAEIRDNLGEHALGLLASEDQREVERHLQWCAGCRKESAELQDGVAAVAMSLPPAEPPFPLERAVVTRVSAAAGKGRTRRYRRGIRVLAATALGAAVLASSAVGWGMRQRNQADLANDRLSSVKQQTADTSKLVQQMQSQLNGTGKLYEASLFPVSRREEGGTALLYGKPDGDGGWVFVDVVAALDRASGPFTVNLVSATGQRLAVGTLTKTFDGDYVLYLPDLPHDFTRPNAVELSQVMALEVIDRLGTRLLTGTVHRFVNTPPSP